MRTRELKVAFMLALLFCAGVFTGVLLDGRLTAIKPMTERPRGPGSKLAAGRDQVMAEMKQKLRFTPQQEQRVGEILDGWSRQLRQQRRDGIQERLDLFERMMPNVRTNLTPEQIPAYNEMAERVRRRHQQMLNRAN